MIIGVVLAAGRSSRMGAPKALLDASGETFLVRAIGALRDGGCAAVIAVVGPNADAVANNARGAGAGVLVNPDADAEQIESLQLAIRDLPDGAEAVIETPVDFPRIQADTVRALIDGFRGSGASVVVPSYNGKHGHPTLFARAAWPELLADDLPEGARTVVHAHAGDLRAVLVPDEGVLLDVDTPDDLRRVLHSE